MEDSTPSRTNMDGFSRAYDLYWTELVQIKVDNLYVGHYRDTLTSRLSWFAIGRAIVSVGALGSWFSGVGHPEVWAGIIVVSQTGEAVVNALPLTARAKNLSAFALALDAIFIDALMEWEDIQSGETGIREINRRRHALMRLRHETEAKHLPTGLPVKRKLFTLAEREAAAYFSRVFGTEPERKS